MRNGTLQGVELSWKSQAKEGWRRAATDRGKGLDLSSNPARQGEAGRENRKIILGQRGGGGESRGRLQARASRGRGGLEIGRMPRRRKRCASPVLVKKEVIRKKNRDWGRGLKAFVQGKKIQAREAVP